MNGIGPYMLKEPDIPGNAREMPPHYCMAFPG